MYVYARKRGATGSLQPDASLMSKAWPLKTHFFPKETSAFPAGYGYIGVFPSLKRQEMVGKKTKPSSSPDANNAHLLRIATVPVTYGHLIGLQEVSVCSRRDKVERELAVAELFQHVRRHEVVASLPHLCRAARVVAVGAVVEIWVIPAKKQGGVA